MNRFPMLIPQGWPVTLAECRPGALLLCPVKTSAEPQICFKSEYRSDGKIEAYNCAGEFLCVSDDHLVQPVEIDWEN